MRLILKIKINMIKFKDVNKYNNFTDINKHD